MRQRHHSIIVALLFVAFSCRSNPFGDTQKSFEDFSLYTTDFQAQTDGGMKDALLEVINGSRATLHCAFSALTLNEVTNALVSRSRAGVAVKVAFDADVQSSDYGALALQNSGSFVVVAVPGESTQGQLLFGNNGTGVMRHNYCLADERFIWLSTAAPDDTQLRRTPNIALKIGSPQFGLARDFLRESSMFSQLLFGNGKAKTDYTTKFTALDQVIGAYWGPQEKPLDVLGTELSEATTKVDFYSTAFQTTNSSKSDLDVPQALLRLESAKGIPLKKYFSSQALFDSASKAYTLTNPAQYVNSSVRVGANIFVVDRGMSSAKAFIYTGALRSQGNSSDDSVLLELRGKRAAEIVGAYLDRIGAVSVVAGNTGDVSIAGAVVINEINWAGSYSNATVSDADDEFLELYNTTSSPINISNWRFACTSDGGATVRSYFFFPAGAVIPANGYFTVASKNSGAFPNAAYYTSALSIPNGAPNNPRECKLTNGKAAASTYAGEPLFTGDVIDTAGDGTTEFRNSGSILGMDDSTNKIRRSMERKYPVTAGNSLASWQSNVNSVSQNTDIGAQFNQKTFGTPGSATSVAVPSIALNRGLYFTTSATHPNGIAKITAINNAANTNAGSLQTINVTATSTADATGVSLTLTETGNNTGIFTSAATGTHLLFTVGASAGNQLSVVSGDTVTLTYTHAGNTYTTTARWYAQNLVINEIGSNCGSATANDYIEILNPNAQVVSLNGMTIYRDSGSSGTACTIGASNYTSSINLSGSIGANSYALAAGSTYAAGGACPAADFIAASSVTVADSNCIALVLSGAGPATATDDEVVDFVGYGNATNPHEGATVAPDMGGGNNQCISRNPNATDTNGNGADFVSEATVPCSPRGATGSLNVISASTGNGLALQVTFNGAPNAVQAQTASNYCIALASAPDCSSPALTVSSPSLSGSTVTLTTSAQAVATSYRVYVTGVTMAAGGGTLLTNSATFSGAAQLPNLKINEVGVTSAGSNDFVEIYNPGASAIDLAAAGIHIQRDSTCSLPGITGTHALTGTIPAGGYYVIAETGNSLANVNQTGLGNIGSGYCVILTSNSTAVTAPNSTNIIDWVTIAGSGTAENGSYAPDTGTNGTIARIPNGTDTNTNAADFMLQTASPGVLNPTPAFNVSSATATAATTVTVTFDRAPNLAQAQAAGNYCIALAAEADCSGPDLTVSGAVLAGNTVTLTTSAQTGGSSYKVYVTGVTGNVGGTALSTNTTTFTGFQNLTANHLVISEIQSGGATAADEFVELYNPTSVGVTLTNYRLRRKTAAGTTTTTWFTFTATSCGGAVCIIAANGYLLVAATGYTGSETADVVGVTAALAADNAIILDDGTNLIDVVAYGTHSSNSWTTAPAGSFTNTNIGNPANNGSIERKNQASATATSLFTGGADETKGNGWDSDVSSNDFVIQTTSKPQNLTRTEVPSL